VCGDRLHADGGVADAGETLAGTKQPVSGKLSPATRPVFQTHVADRPRNILADSRFDADDAAQVLRAQVPRGSIRACGGACVGLTRWLRQTL